MDKKKIGIIAGISVVVLIIGITIGFFIGKSTVVDASASTTAAEETTEVTEETTTEATAEETTTEVTTTKSAKYEDVSETVYATSDVNIRSGASTDSSVISALKKGQSIERTAIGDNGWSKVSYKGKTAYISSKYLTTTAPEQPVNVNISNTDMNNLVETLDYIFFYGPTTYNCKDKDAFEKAFGIIHGAPFMNFADVVTDVYRIEYENVVNFPEGDDSFTDPKGYWQQYRYVEEKFIDLILEEIFNVKPDHSYVMHNYDWYGDESMVFAYYQDGYYYSDAGDGGDGCGPEITVNKVERLSDGKYKITVHYNVVGYSADNELEIIEDNGDFIVVAEMKNIDGKTVWSYHEISPVK